jgi:hypothetical protein
MRRDAAEARKGETRREGDDGKRKAKVAESGEPGGARTTTYLAGDARGGSRSPRAVPCRLSSRDQPHHHEPLIRAARRRAEASLPPVKEDAATRGVLTERGESISTGASK